MRYARISIFAALAALVLSLAGPADLWATPEYSERTGQGCKTCHTAPMDGELNDTGLKYAASGYTWPPSGGYRVMGPIRKTVRYLVGFLHMAAGFLWFGTILYVHLLLRPAYASSGLPRGEVGVGLASMAVVGVTGVLLTISRINSVSVLYESEWGVTLSIKIALYAVMVASAGAVVAFVSPRLRKPARKAELPEDGVFGPAALEAFDGKEGRPALIAYKGAVYDVTGLKLWRGGAHMKHRSGTDLTDALAKAPHGEEKLEGLRRAGSFDPALKPPLNAAQKAFYFVAYMNLALVFAVLFVIAYWRWGI
ncbi:MAG: hypothetical protein Kow0025_03090 [Thermodesulfovibrionales bacterium]